MDLKDFAKLIHKRRRIKSRASRFALENFDFIGITEEYKASMELLKRKYLPDLTLDVEPERVNPAKKVGEAYVLDDETYAYLADLYAPMLTLYDEAVKHFRAECLRAQISLGQELNKV